ncbi:MAG: hypothetical protein WCL32_05215 [Planctomycetota bacterium]
MNHHTTTDFWDGYNKLPKEVRKLADENYALLRSNPRHPSLHFKRVGKLWSVRVGIGFRALAVDGDDGPIWFWIGSHAEYDRIIDNS